MRALRLVERFVYESSDLGFALGLVWLVLIKVGLWVYPSLEIKLAIARNPFDAGAVPEGAQYLFSSWLAPFVAWVVGIDGFNAFLALNLGFAIAFVALFALLAVRRLPPATARTALALFVMLPVSGTVFFWVGIDAVTLLLLLAALAAARRPVLVALLGLLVGMEHFEQAFIGVAALTAALVLGRRSGDAPAFPVGAAVALLAGVVAGKLVLVGIFALHGVHPGGDRLGWMLPRLGRLAWHFAANVQTVLWSTLGVGWLVVVRHADRGRRAVPFLLMLAAACLTIVATADQTRVGAVVTFPLIYAFWFADRAFLDGLRRAEVAAFFGIWIVVPWTWTVLGQVAPSAFPYDLAVALHALFGWFDPALLQGGPLKGP